MPGSSLPRRTARLLLQSVMLAVIVLLFLIVASRGQIFQGRLL